MEILSNLKSALARNHGTVEDGIAILSVTLVPKGAVVVYKRLAAKFDLSDEYRAMFYSYKIGCMSDIIASE